MKNILEFKISASLQVSDEHISEVKKVLAQHLGLYCNGGSNVIINIGYLADSVEPVTWNGNTLSPLSFVLDVLDLSEECVKKVDYIELYAL